MGRTTVASAVFVEKAKSVMEVEFVGRDKLAAAVGASNRDLRLLFSSVSWPATGPLFGLSRGAASALVSTALLWLALHDAGVSRAFRLGDREGDSDGEGDTVDGGDTRRGS